MRNLAKVRSRVGLWFLALFFWCGQGYASHYWGFEMWHEVVDTGTIDLFYGRYFDCGGAASVPLSSIPPQPTIMFVPANGPTSQPFSVGFGWTLVQFIDATPVCPTLLTNCMSSTFPTQGVTYHVYKRTYTLPQVTSSSVYWVVESECCRPYNLTNGGGDGVYFRHLLDFYNENSSPRFDPMEMIVCNNRPSVIFVGGSDPDNDDLRYRLDTCRATVNNTLNYSPGNSPTQPFGPNWNVELDSLTGHLYVNPTPGGSFISPICIEVSEYRNGVLVGRTTRDVIVASVNCPQPNTPPIILGLNNVSGADSIGLDSLFFCPNGNVPVSFEIGASDLVNSNQILSFKHNILWALPGSSVSVTGSNPARVLVNWQPTPADTIPKTLVIVVNDNACPIRGSNARVFKLIPSETCISSTIQPTTFCLQSNGTVNAQFFGFSGQVNYLWSTGATTPSISGLAAGNYWVRLTHVPSGFVASDTFLVTSDDLSLRACSGI